MTHFKCTFIFPEVEYPFKPCLKNLKASYKLISLDFNGADYAGLCPNVSLELWAAAVVDL